MPYSLTGGVNKPPNVRPSSGGSTGGVKITNVTYQDIITLSGNIYNNYNYNTSLSGTIYNNYLTQNFVNESLSGIIYYNYNNQQIINYSLSGSIYNNYNILNNSINNFRYKQFFINSVNSLSYGNISAVSLIMDASNNYLFNFSLVQGQQGIQGIQGPQGKPADIFNTGSSEGSSALGTILGMIGSILYTSMTEAILTSMGFATISSLASRILVLQGEVAELQREQMVDEYKIDILESKVETLESSVDRCLDRIAQLEEKVKEVSCSGGQTTIYGPLNVVNVDGLDLHFGEYNSITGNTKMNGRIIYTNPFDALQY